MLLLTRHHFDTPPLFSSPRLLLVQPVSIFWFPFPFFFKSDNGPHLSCHHWHHCKSQLWERLGKACLRWFMKPPQVLIQVQNPMWKVAWWHLSEPCRGYSLHVVSQPERKRLSLLFVSLSFETVLWIQHRLSHAKGICTVTAKYNLRLQMRDAGGWHFFHKDNTNEVG